MTVQEIQRQVNEIAAERFGEIVRRAFDALRHRHTHNSWRGDCACEYCIFIRGDYVKAKLALHQIKKLINRMEWYGTDTEVKTMDAVYQRQLAQKLKVLELKEHKKQLKGNNIP